MTENSKAQFCEHIDKALQTLREDPDVAVDKVIDCLCSDIRFWESNTEISRKYLIPLKSKSVEDVERGLEYVKLKYREKGDPTFCRW